MTVQFRPTNDGIARLPYATPIVSEYGTLRDVTLTVGATSNKNDGGSGSTKTS